MSGTRSKDYYSLRKNRNRSRQKRKIRQEAARLARLAIAEIPVGTAPLSPADDVAHPGTAAQANCQGSGGSVETALFQNHHQLGPDVAMVRRALREGWPVEKSMAIEILRSAADKAMDPAASIPQKVMVVKMFSELDGKNQSDAHHRDRMEYLERNREDRAKERAKVGEYKPGFNVGVSGNATANLQIVLPHNFRDEGMLTEDHIELPEIEPLIE